ncbi:MAG: alpha/beta fold hydrolase [Xenococcaceae cyanobacterium MO_167.B52]|nr:alpha/beta fold hydrolase [Xenococcaceae cyanobacterium MO_167.B52]
MQQNQPWQQRIGNQREWIWRGWQIRYSYMRTNDQTSRPPLILLHGFGASIEHWRNNIPVLKEKYTVYALDLLGFGASRKADTNYTVDLWVEQVRDFWLTMINQPVILVGNSIGSLVCLRAAETYPDMVQGLVMLSLPDVSLRQEMLPKLIQPLVNTVENLVASPLLIKNLLKLLRRPRVIKNWAKVAYEDTTAVNDELVSILSAPAYDDGSGETFYALFQGVKKSSFAPGVKQMLPQLNIPILLIWGLKDRMIPPSLAGRFAQLNPRIELVELPGVGHCPHDECPDKFNHIFLDWLERSIDFKESI